MLFYEEVGSESRPVCLPAELRAQPSPGAGGQLEVLVLQGSCEGPEQKQASPHAPRIFLSFKLERDKLVLPEPGASRMGHLLYLSVQRVQVRGSQSYQDTLFTSTMSIFLLCPSPLRTDQYDCTSNHDIRNAISPQKITAEKYWLQLSIS